MHTNISNLPRTWTVIAERPREPARGCVLTWTENPGALISLEDAQRYAAEGVIFMANRHHDDRVELVIQARVSAA